MLKGAYWEGETELLLLETYSSTQQIVALSTTESEYISTKMLLMLWRSAVIWRSAI